MYFNQNSPLKIFALPKCVARYLGPINSDWDILIIISLKNIKYFLWVVLEKNKS